MLGIFRTSDPRHAATRHALKNVTLFVAASMAIYLVGEKLDIA